MMTRKDYELIAEVLSEEVGRLRGADISNPYNAGQSHKIHATIDRFAIALAEDNPRFDRDRFIKAATLPDYRDH